VTSRGIPCPVDVGLLTRLDRRAGTRLRRTVGAMPGGRTGARVAAGALSPGFRVIVALMIIRPGSRRAGLEALAAGAGAATAARLLRDRLARRRPGPRAEAGFPSRHAAAAAAIARAAGRRHRLLGRALAAAAVVGLAARIASADHEPADIAAGAALGLAADRAVERLAGAG
jgi:membrane-associated phospholipid phosphatase